MKYLMRSSWWDPDGSNYDEYVWDRFVLGYDADVDSVEWRGAYDPAYGGNSPVVNFTVAIYASSVGGSEPDVAHPPLVEYENSGNAGEMYAGVFGGTTMDGSGGSRAGASPAARAATATTSAANT